MRAEGECFAVLHLDIGFRDLRFSGAHALDLPAHEGDSRLVALFDEVIETRLAIDGDRRQRVLGLHRGKFTNSPPSVPALRSLCENPSAGSVSAKYSR